MADMKRLGGPVFDWLRRAGPWDFLAGLGLALVAIGLWWIYPPACLITVGLVLLFVGVWGARLWATRRK